MMLRRAPVRHVCHPPQWWEWPPSGKPHPGDLWQCENCDRVFLAEDAWTNHAVRGQRTVGAIEWREVRGRRLRKLLR